MPAMSSVEACRKYDITYRQLHNWITVGYVSVQEGGGTGNPYYLDWQQVDRLEALVALVKAGMRAGVAVQLLEGDTAAYERLAAAMNELDGWLARERLRSGRTAS